MMRFVYTCLIILMLPFAFIRLYWRGRKNPGYRQNWAERFGKINFHLPECIWVHAVSLGETIAAEPMVKRLLTQYPNLPIVLTSMTPTGRSRALSLRSERIYVCHLPYDLPWLLSRFIKKVNPKLMISMETELWPNLIATTKQHHIPMILANARMSERSANGYAYIKSLTRPMLESFARVAVQNHEDGERLLKLGVPEDKLVVTGSIKFDLSLPDNIQTRAQQLKAMWPHRPVWIAASTHPGEEEQVLAAHKTVLNTLPNALLILVPRHPERFASVKTLCQTQGFTVVTRSSAEPCDTHTQVYVGDTMGELLVYYASADIAYVGGSLVNTGGHNPLEPAALGLPVVMGPHTFNFKQITQLLVNAGASLTVNNAEQLAHEILRLFANPASRLGMGEKGLSTVLANRGALDKLMGLIAEHV